MLHVIKSQINNSVAYYKKQSPMRKLKTLYSESTHQKVNNRINCPIDSPSKIKIFEDSCL